MPEQTLENYFKLEKEISSRYGAFITQVIARANGIFSDLIMKESGFRVSVTLLGDGDRPIKRFGYKIDVTNMKPELLDIVRSGTKYVM